MDIQLPVNPPPQTPYEQKIVEDSINEFKHMQTYRHVFNAHCQEVAELILPEQRNTFEFGNYNWQGEKRTHRQVDATGMMALRKFRAICDSLITPKNMFWHGLQADDDYVMKDRATRLWFEQVTKILFKYRYKDLANFVMQNSNDYMQLGAFGSSYLFIDELDNTLFPGEVGLRYKSLPWGEVWIRENHQGIVDGFVRWIRMTAMQCYQKWGKERFPPALYEPLQKGSQILYDFIHRVCPRTDYDPDRWDYKGKQFASYYISLKGEHFLSEGGYRMLPMAAARYEMAPWETYGRSPAMMVLPSLKTLNAEKRTYLKVGHRAADPVLLTTDDGIVDFVNRPGELNKGGMSLDGKPLVGTLPVGDPRISEEMMQQEVGLIQDAFLVNLFQLALNLKDMPEMTATQVIEIMNQKSILLAPTVGGLESSRNGPMIERELDVLSNLVDPYTKRPVLPPMPPRLREARGAYAVVPSSPIARARRSQEAAGFIRTVEISKEMINITGDQSHLDWAAMDRAMPAIAEINGTPEEWKATQEEIAAKRQGRAKVAQEQQRIQALPAEAAMKKADAAVAKAGVVPPAQQPARPGAPLEQVPA